MFFFGNHITCKASCQELGSPAKPCRLKRGFWSIIPDLSSADLDLVSVIELPYLQAYVGQCVSVASQVRKKASPSELWELLAAAHMASENVWELLESNSEDENVWLEEWLGGSSERMGGNTYLCKQLLGWGFFSVWAPRS